MSKCNNIFTQHSKSHLSNILNLDWNFFLKEVPCILNLNFVYPKEMIIKAKLLQISSNMIGFISEFLNLNELFLLLNLNKQIRKFIIEKNQIIKITLLYLKILNEDCSIVSTDNCIFSKNLKNFEITSILTYNFTNLLDLLFSPVQNLNLLESEKTVIITYILNTFRFSKNNLIDFKNLKFEDYTVNSKYLKLILTSKKQRFKIIHDEFNISKLCNFKIIRKFYFDILNDNRCINNIELLNIPLGEYDFSDFFSNLLKSSELKTFVIKNFVNESIGNTISVKRNLCSILIGMSDNTNFEKFRICHKSQFDMEVYNHKTDRENSLNNAKIIINSTQNSRNNLEAYHQIIDTFSYLKINLNSIELLTTPLPNSTFYSILKYFKYCNNISISSFQAHESFLDIIKSLKLLHNVTIITTHFNKSAYIQILEHLKTVESFISIRICDEILTFEEQCSTEETYMNLVKKILSKRSVKYISTGD